MSWVRSPPGLPSLQYFANRTSMLRSVLAAALFLLSGSIAGAAEPMPHEGDFMLHDFVFKDGETLKELKLHYTTLGTATRDAQGRVTNAILILHGTGGDGHQFLRPQFSGVLFVPGGLLDASKYFI